ncbi:hypothetical protein TD95_002094 [Thielaviopsis punctulata]|uniref:Uncharacterized protein n=1 Tax=Thielaviopsis punctulata TaxID=72032 RepID=A0A0F4ZBI9_9PEZI|nr:hypothetical protein TD95_002094 [Thielaviopsis punctulata]
MLSIRWIVNGGLLGLPIGVTLAILFALQEHHRSTGQGGSLWTDNKVVTTQYCQKSYGITPESDGQQYTLNPNQWGVDSTTTGGLCMNVTTHNNGTYATNTTAPLWSVTWKYSQGPETQPVHAYPNAKLDGVLPDRLSSISAINMTFHWNYDMGNDSATTTDTTTLVSNSVNANVAMDLFIDSDKTQAQNSSSADYEIMVWFAAIGSATQAIGQHDGVLATETAGGVSFSLYGGTNSLSQKVLTWMPASPVTKFDGDLMSLVNKTLSLTGEMYPSSSDYLGYLAIGSETYYSNDFVTFTVSDLAIDLKLSA